MTAPDSPVALITGASGNLGRATALALAQAGMRLVLAVSPRQPCPAFDDLPPGTGKLIVPVELTDPTAVANLVMQTGERFGGLQILIHLAGGFSMGPALHETTPDDWQRMFDVNLRSLFEICRAAVPAMLTAGWGRIVTISARAAREGRAQMGPYCAAKASVITLTETLSAELKHQGITANCLLPGTIDTPQNRSAMPDADTTLWVPPAGIAAVIRFLVSEEAAFVTGAAIPVYGKG